MFIVLAFLLMGLMFVSGWKLGDSVKELMGAISYDQTGWDWALFFRVCAWLTLMVACIPAAVYVINLTDN